MSQKVKNKIAIILFNLGSPDKKESIKPFLFNFFMDKNIIRAPLPIRYLLAKYISVKRSKNEAANSYNELNNKSPLLENSIKQAQALEDKLNIKSVDEFKSFVCMRYWHPMADEVVKQVKAWGADKIVLLPLYPQYSTTTTRSSFQSWDKACSKNNLDIPSRKIESYFVDEGFITASAKNIRAVYDKALKQSSIPLRILFSAHGLPEKIIKAGDPYQLQCEQTAAAIVKKLNIPNLDWQSCYQSRVGRLKWIAPSTKDALKKAAQDNVSVIIYPHAFTQEHVETLVEIEIEYRELAKTLGVSNFYRVRTVGTDLDFIKGLSAQVLNVL